MDKIVFFVNYYYDIDIEHLYTAFERLGYKTEKLKNLDSFEKLRKEIVNKLANNKIVKKVVVIFLGYCCDYNELSQNMVIGHNVNVSCSRFCALFSNNIFHPDKSIAVFTNLCIKPNVKCEILYYDDDEDKKLKDTEQMIIVGHLESGLLLSRALSNTLNQITMTSQIKFSRIISTIRNYILKQLIKDGHDTPYITVQSYKIAKSFRFSKTEKEVTGSAPYISPGVVVKKKRKRIKKKSKLVFFINYYYDLDIEPLSAAFRNLGYKIKNVKSLECFDNLQDEINNEIEIEKRSKIITKVVVIFLGYGGGGGYLSDYMFIGDDDIVSCRKFCNLFSGNIYYQHKSIAVIANLCYKPKAEGKRLYDDNDEDKNLKDTHQGIIMGSHKTGLLLTRALRNELSEITMTSKFKFSNMRFRIQNYIRSELADDDEYKNNLPFFNTCNYGTVKDFIFSKTDKGEIDPRYNRLIIF